jgi:hypothetical protein
MSSTSEPNNLVELPEMDLEPVTAGKGPLPALNLPTPAYEVGPPAFLATAWYYPPFLRYLASRGRVGPGEDHPITRYVQP